LDIYFCMIIFPIFTFRDYLCLQTLIQSELSFYFLLHVSLLLFILRKCIGVKGIMAHVGVCVLIMHNHVLKCL